MVAARGRRGGVGLRAGQAAVLGAGRDRFRPSGGRIRVAAALATELRMGEVGLFGGCVLVPARGGTTAALHPGSFHGCGFGMLGSVRAVDGILRA